MGAILTLKGGKRGASALIGYVSRRGDLDTDRIYTHEISKNYKLAQAQLSAERRIFRKTDGIQAFHWIQSFDSDFDKNNKAHVKKAHEIGASLVDAIAEAYPNHEIYMATHTDSDSGYIHNHIVFSSLNVETGVKFYSSKDVGYHLHDLNDLVLTKYGIEPAKEKYKKIDYRMHLQGQRSNREETKHMIIQAKQKAHDFESFKAILNDDYGVEVYEFNRGKRIGYSWTNQNGEDFSIGARKLGTDFEKERILLSFEEPKIRRKKEPLQDTKAIVADVPASDDTGQAIIDRIAFNAVQIQQDRERIEEQKELEKQKQKEKQERLKKQNQIKKQPSRSNGWDLEL